MFQLCGGSPTADRSVGPSFALTEVVSGAFTASEYFLV